jgi:Mg/Co/Ni transporter MgtE
MHRICNPEIVGSIPTQGTNVTKQRQPSTKNDIMEQTISDIVQRAKDIDAAEAASELYALADVYKKTQEAIKEQQEQFWNSFTKQQQLDLFCSVVRRIYQAEIVERRSYRGTLYDVFGFDADAYGIAMEAGYITLHNSICFDDWAEDEKDS